MHTNVVVTAPKMGGPVEEWDGSYTVSGGTISFTIDGVSYEAEDVMTWEQWCNSEYNTGGIFIEAGFVRKGYLIVAANGYGYVKPADTIIANTAYVLANGGAND